MQVDGGLNGDSLDALRAEELAKNCSKRSRSGLFSPEKLLAQDIPANHRKLMLSAGDLEMQYGFSCEQFSGHTLGLDM